ncbi:hypothetical protein A3K82_00640 [Candidatus Pacearchaeota archaeon RBG_19FT_COMBO_34_9]|nr:MAG: hypothetical protein A3K82_00640 [Candidatus Pacearchaeota archaeon RBG_19FT_COMBO_34_9]OGJ16882.1 MAG: hypothetical protein A3K74_03535 [Candidatus Pacearchaeota archaeon RBG_13_33_26]
MSEKYQRDIKKPWVVCYRLINLSIGRVTEDFGKTLYIQFFENQPSKGSDSEWVKKFDNPIKAIAYFKFKKCKSYTKEEAINFFLTKFPSEKKRLENLLAPSQSKCTINLEKLERDLKKACPLGPDDEDELKLGM